MKSQNFVLKALLLVLVGISFVACAPGGSSSGAGGSGYGVLSSTEQATLADGIFRAVDGAPAHSYVSGLQLISTPAAAAANAKLTATQAIDLKTAINANCTKTMTPSSVSSFPAHIEGSLVGANCPISMTFVADVEGSSGVSLKVISSVEMRLVAEPWASATEISLVNINSVGSYQVVGNAAYANTDSKVIYKLKEGTQLSLHFYGTSIQPDKSISGNYTKTVNYDFSYKGISARITLVTTGEVGKAAAQKVYLNGEEITDANREKFKDLIDAFCKLIMA